MTESMSKIIAKPNPAATSFIRNSLSEIPQKIGGEGNA